MFPHKNIFQRCLLSLIVLIGLWLLMSCQEEQPVLFKAVDHKDYVFKNKWLSNDENFELPNYQENFNAYFEEGLKQNNHEQASDALLSVFHVMASRGYYQEDYYYDVLKKYVKNHQSFIHNDHLFTFYIYLGSFETFQGSFAKAINTLSELDSLEPNNYSTFSDLGYAYYYISCNFYYLGDYIKSMEALKKSSFYFGHTDNYNGLANVEIWRANLHFISKNLDEAVRTMDKAMAFNENLKDPEGQARLMLGKYDYMVHLDYVKADQYLDSIDKFITEKKIQYIPALLHFNQVKIKKLLTEKNIPELNQLMPVFESQVKKANIENYKNLFASASARYQLLKNQQVTNKTELLNLLEIYKQNKNYLLSIDVLKILQDEAVLEGNINQVLAYQKDIDQIEKSITDEDLQFKVKVFEKKIDAEKKEKIIAQQQSKISKNNFYIIGLILSLVILSLATILFLLKRRKKEMQKQAVIQEQFTFQLLQNTEEERSRIAGELHDSVNHDLLHIKNNLIHGNKIFVEDIGNIIEEVRNISRNLHPAVLEKIGLEASIESMCERVSEIGLFTTCEINYDNSLSKNKELQLYRIIQEALNNTLKHGKANAARVILHSENNYLHLEIKDNGNGFDVNQQLKNPKSFGLQSILQRAKAIAGIININSNDKGTQIFIKIPI